MSKKRKAGDGTLRLRKDGRWEGRVLVDYDEKGLPVTKSVTSKSKQECLKKLEDLKTACPAPISTETFTSFASLASTLIALPFAAAMTRTTSDAPR